MINDWNTCGGNCEGDVNFDSLVNTEDLFILIAAWGACP